MEQSSMAEIYLWNGNYIHSEEQSFLSNVVIDFHQTVDLGLS